MTLLPWKPEPAPFGNATGFDTVALDVQIAIAISMGMKVYRGCFPEDIQTEQEAHRERCPECGQADNCGDCDHTPNKPDPLKTITISHDGLKISGNYNGHRSVSGYRSGYWLDQMTPDTVVFDIRTLPWESAKSYAIRGPLLGVDLPEGVVSKLDPLDSIMADVAEQFMNSVGATLEETGAEVMDSDFLTGSERES